MTTALPHRSLAILKLPNKVPDLLKQGRGVVTAMTGNAFFLTPNPPLADVTAVLNTLDVTETASLTRAKGAAEARNTAKVAAIAKLQDTRGYVQTVADADRENAEKIITSAAMSVRKSPARTKNDFEVKAGSVSSSVQLVARAAGRRAAYDWQWSSDGGKTWTDAPSTLQSKTTITGLPVGVVCQFRFRPITKTGEGNWSQVISFLVK